ncbi:hypothetical protein OG394_19390 [Kribbella sp. NBC_01245]|uniref:hypothetical protein n=1 Tax=Kribbella sp. NBC_01245 TaxID=2903578 RepID=UPI002E2946C8|nr:hypothetical protein [Kribbella sp. NBC_01245]
MNRRPRIALTAVLAISAGLLTACGSNQPNGGAPTPFDALTTQSAQTTPSPGTSAAPPKPARLSAQAAAAKLKVAQRAQVKADTARFVQSLVVDAQSDGVLTTRLDGRYRISTRSSEGVMTNTGTGTFATQLGTANGAVFRIRVIKQNSYLNVPMWPVKMRHCWMAQTADEVFAAAGLEAKGEATMPAANMETLMSGAASGGEGDELTGSVDVLPAVALFGSGVMGKLKRPESLTGRIPARFRVGPAGVEKVTIAGKPLAGVLQRTKQGFTTDGLATIDAMTVTITYSNWRTPVSVQRPPKSLLLKPTQKTCGP